MKFTIADPMPALKARAEELVNEFYYATTSAQHLEHTTKKIVAQQLKSDPSVTPAWFLEAAEVEGLQPLKFAELIISKPDGFMDNAVARRRTILAVRGAKTPADLDEILKQLTK